MFHMGSPEGRQAFYQLFLFIQIENYLWNLVFHLGSQMGNETFYHLILFIQIGSYLWNLVFHMGSPNGRRGLLPIGSFLLRSGTTCGTWCSTWAARWATRRSTVSSSPSGSGTLTERWGGGSCSPGHSSCTSARSGFVLAMNCL